MLSLARRDCPQMSETHRLPPPPPGALGTARPASTDQRGYWRRAITATDSLNSGSAITSPACLSTGTASPIGFPVSVS